jgi:hypothetical protein
MAADKKKHPMMSPVDAHVRGNGIGSHQIPMLTYLIFPIREIRVIRGPLFHSRDKRPREILRIFAARPNPK